MNTELKSSTIFPSNEVLLAWISAHGDQSLVAFLLKFAPATLTSIRGVFNEFGAYVGKADIGETSTLLGRAMGNFFEIVKKEPSLPNKEDKKAFISAAALTHFRLLNKGLDGTAQNFMSEHAAHLHKAFPNGPEQDFVLPMADQAVDRIIDMLYRMKNP